MSKRTQQGTQHPLLGAFLGIAISAKAVQAGLGLKIGSPVQSLGRRMPCHWLTAVVNKPRQTVAEAEGSAASAHSRG